MNGSAPIVIALGGNAISPADIADTIPRQFEQATNNARLLVPLLQGPTPIVITHGNGPQIGQALRRIELSCAEVYALPLDVCVADIQGGMGYMIAQCLRNELRRAGTDRSVSAIVTTVVVDTDDPAFASPTKPVGPMYPVDDASTLRERGWTIVEIPGRGVRRVVASPRPTAIVEIDLIRRLVAAGDVIIAVGGGGIPVVQTASGMFEGREAVIDKDRASALLACEIDAGQLVIVTNVAQVMLDFTGPHPRPLDQLTIAEARKHQSAGQFAAGSMGPKIDAAIAFLEGSSPRPTNSVVITDIASLAAALRGEAGTSIVPNR